MNQEKNPDWSELYRRYLEAVAAVSGTHSGPQDNPWQQALRFWSMPPASSSGLHAAGPLPQADAFGPMAGYLGQFLNRIAGAGNRPDWESNFKTALEGFRSQAASPSNWRWPSAADTPGARFDAAAAWAPWRAAPEPEIRDKVQEGLRLWTEYQERLQDYQSEMARIAGRALDLLGESILEASRQERVFANVREIYDLWVDCSERAYGERISTEDHARCFAGMVNALTAFRINAQQVTGGLPGADAPDLAADVDDLRQQQAGMKQELDESRAQRERDAEVIDALRQELEQLKQKLQS